MKAHGEIEISDRSSAQDDARQEIQGQLPKGHFEFADDLTFDSLKPGGGANTIAEYTRQRLQRALRRDAMYGSAGSVYLRAMGQSQAIREIYDGGRQLMDGGLK